MEGTFVAAAAAPSSAAGAPAAGAGGASLCPSTTMGVPQLLQGILTFRPRTLPSAMVYFAPHAWQLTFIDRYLALNLQKFRDTGKLWAQFTGTRAAPHAPQNWLSPPNCAPQTGQILRVSATAAWRAAYTRGGTSASSCFGHTET